MWETLRVWGICGIFPANEFWVLGAEEGGDVVLGGSERSLCLVWSIVGDGRGGTLARNRKTTYPFPGKSKAPSGDVGNAKKD